MKILAAWLCIVASSALAAPVERADFGKYFQQAGTDGTIYVYDVRTHSAVVFNPARAEKGFLPASTFKVLNSLIGLETGVVKDVDNQIFPWDGVRRDVPEWNRDQTLRTAIKFSVVPVYQSIARQIGPQRMAHYVQAVGYGNADISGVAIDQFWLNGRLRISAHQQVEFLTRLCQNDLPFSRRTMDLVKDITIVEKTDAYTMHAKTGWAKQATPQIGWFVGWVEHGQDVDVFALNLDVLKPEDAAARIDVTKKVLHELGAI